MLLRCCSKRFQSFYSFLHTPRSIAKARALLYLLSAVFFYLSARALKTPVHWLLYVKPLVALYVWFANKTRERKETETPQSFLQPQLRSERLGR